MSLFNLFKPVVLERCCDLQQPLLWQQTIVKEDRATTVAVIVKEDCVIM